MNSTPKKFKPKNPWSPLQIAWICAIFGIIPATVLWAINSRRLKAVLPGRTLGSILAGFAVYLVIAVRLFLVEDDSAEYYHFRSLSLIMTLVLAWQIFMSQQGVFARHRKSGGKTAAFWSPLLIGLLYSSLAASAELGVESIRTGRDYSEFHRVTESMGKDKVANKEAEVYFNNFKRKYPNETISYSNLALIYDRSNKVEEAKDELRGMLKLEPSNKEARDYLHALGQE